MKELFCSGDKIYLKLLPDSFTLPAELFVLQASFLPLKTFTLTKRKISKNGNIYDHEN